MKKNFIFLLGIILISVSCNTVSKDLKSAYNLTQCQYSYRDISNLSLSGINLSNSNALSLTNVATLTSILSGNANSIPLNFTVNMDVKNPNQATAALSGLRYNLKIDGINFTSGVVNEALNVPAGGTSILPLTIGVDIATLMKTESQSSIANIVKNFIGIGNEKSNVSLELFPTINVVGSSFSSPVAIPVSFSFGGK
ncbi:MAG: LEA type 2 family protein [Candidatus Azobacteroides sp.]|nr:LEA type 2 family protein [Candidatus Azobacteroides sp.]